MVAAVEVNVPELMVARTAIGDFQSMIRSKSARKLNEWLEAAKDSLVGQITRLKLIKRQMYGRAKLDLLQARLLGVRQPFASAKSASEP